MPGVFTHGNFDTWSPGYLMFIAATHNGISRLYETFGNGGADTRGARRCGPTSTRAPGTSRTRRCRKAMWSQRNNNNYEQTGLLTSLHYFAANRQLFLRNFYEKSKRSILKAKTEGPAAYVLPADDPRPGAQAELLRVLQKQGVEISRATAAFTVTVPAKAAAAAGRTTTDAAVAAAARARRRGGPAAGRGRKRQAKPPTPPGADDRATFPAGSYIVRMDQPYSAHRRRAARLSVLEPERSAEDAVRRHRLDVPRAASTCRPCASPTRRCSTRRWRR